MSGGMENARARCIKPGYYKGTIQPIDVVRDWELPYCLGNVIKYLCRYKYKGSPLNDLEKASHYLRLEIDHIRSTEVHHP